MAAKASYETGIEKANEIILSGGLVAFPTESFYGLAVNATDEDAVRRLFLIKKRPVDQPILILIPSLEMLDQYVSNISETAHLLIRRFWPGGLTLVFEAGRNIPPLLTGGSGKIGIRLSSHNIATDLAKRTGIAITGTSANVSGAPPCVTAEEVQRSLGNELDLILDGGETNGGKGSTILDVTVVPPRIIREGMISYEQIKVFL
ncbi:L-threonylcarbamoyladenylate synthase [Thermodesulfobacteriota bacterium]